MDSPRITYTPRHDAMPEAELNTLVAVYCFLLDRHAKKKGGPATAPEARKEIDGSGEGWRDEGRRA